MSPNPNPIVSLVRLLILPVPFVALEIAQVSKAVAYIQLYAFVFLHNKLEQIGDIVGVVPGLVHMGGAIDGHGQGLDIREILDLL